MTKIKICGLSREVDMDSANRLMPDYIGFVFAKTSRRYVSPERAAKLKALLRPEIQSVGVFVREEPETVAAIANEGIVELIQLHGNEDEDYLRALRKLTDKPIIKAFSVTAEDIRTGFLREEQSQSDLILLDHGSGGTGQAFDWTCLRAVKRPFFLAGGITPDNVAEAIRRYAPYGVDVSSGVEKNGYKDDEAMERLIQQARRS